MLKTTTRAAYFALALLTLVMSLSFAACTGKQPEAAPTAQPTAEAVNTAGATESAPEGTEPVATVDPNYHYLTYEEVYNPETDFDNGLGHAYTTILSTEDAYYFPGTLPGYLYYYDKLTGEGGVLCPKPECVHDSIRNNKDCCGLICADNGTTVNLYNGKIYYMTYDGTDRHHYLYRIDLDGTRREKICKMDGGSHYEPQHAYIHRGKLYGVQWFSQVIDAEPFHTWNVTCWNIETGEYKVVCEEENMISEPSLFFFGKYVFICVSYTESEMTEDYEMIYGDTTIKVFRYDTETERFDTLLNVKGPDYCSGRYMIAVAAENKIYIAPVSVSGSSSIYLVENGELKELFKVDAPLTTLFADKIVVSKYVNLGSKEISELRWHFTVMDYQGSVLWDETVGFGLLFGISDRISNVSLVGVYSDGDAVFAAYMMRLDVETSEEVSSGRTCLVKYELVDGKLVETLIAVQNWVG